MSIVPVGRPRGSPFSSFVGEECLGGGLGLLITGVNVSLIRSVS